mmetsp:Transcript_21174/g.46193  ORF Transcript_21174/g.46193 Transcript_21174/m.46193 type:complete len:93 (+) Transcript_21174:424-702(+)
MHSEWQNNGIANPVAQPPNQTIGGSIHEPMRCVHEWNGLVSFVGPFVPLEAVGVSENENDRITNGRTDEIVVGYPRTATATESHVRSWHEHE